MSIGPVQLLILGFEDPQFNGEILDELKRLKEADVVRVIDAAVVRKNDDGSVDMLHTSDLSDDEAMEFGATIGALIGLGAAGEDGLVAGAEAGAEAMADGGSVIGEEDVWYAADVIPTGTATAIALLEHRWAIPLRDSIARANGFVLADEWIHAKDLVAIGVLASADA
ncbi:MAG TPA: hypothetical protein VMB53_14955 [Gaiellaceae bacterium]|nr:hypothetical protein [Gaiellaceae bacterium]